MQYQCVFLNSRIDIVIHPIRCTCVAYLLFSCWCWCCIFGGGPAGRPAKASKGPATSSALSSATSTSRYRSGICFVQLELEWAGFMKIYNTPLRLNNFYCKNIFTLRITRLRPPPGTCDWRRGTPGSSSRTPARPPVAVAPSADAAASYTTPRHSR